jgi:streptogramin lyase
MMSMQRFISTPSFIQPIVKNVIFSLSTACFLAATGMSHAADFSVTDEAGKPVSVAMVSQISVEKMIPSVDDQGYPTHGQLNRAPAENTRFTRRDGTLSFDDVQGSVNYRVRKPGYYDVYLESQSPNKDQSVVLKPMTAVSELAADKSSNLWLDALDFGENLELKKRFQLNCAFCHQQASEFMRAERSEAEWQVIFERMNSYGSRLAEVDFDPLAKMLADGYKDLRENPEKIPDAKPWDEALAGYEITEWPIGDAFSQQHDFIIHPNGLIYVGDNLHDRIYEVNPENGEYTVYVVPHAPDTPVGGFMGNRFKVFPKMNNYLGVHSFAISPSDGHIFITPSMDQSLLEFDPETKEFTTHKMVEGYYAHTIRADEKNRIWFTLAASSQIGMLDRNKGEFKFYNLPARSLKEWVILKSLPLIFAFKPENRPEPTIDTMNTGVPMPYGIDIASDGTVWFARLYGNDIGFINPEDDTVTMIKTPFDGPRRMRVDADNNVWIVAFQDSQLVRYNPKTKQFTHFDMPVANELPYSLNVDREKGVVWVNGNQSDTIFSFDIATEQWMIFPLPRKRTFTRDIEFEANGDVFTTNSNFPSWQIEDGQPTLIRLRPVEAE